MCRELKCLVSIVLVLFMAGSTMAELVGYWKFDEGAGTVAADSSGSGNNGTLNGVPQWVAGKLGGALDFDGSADYVEVPHAASLSITDAITIAAWTNMRANASGEMAIVSKGGWAANDLPYELTEEAGGVIFWQFYDDQGRDTCSPNSPSAGEWHHIAATYDGTIFKCYIDGVLAEEWAYTGKMPQNTASVTIGRRSRGGTFFNGMIDDVAIFNRALSADEIPNIMMGVGGFGPASAPTPPDGAIHLETWVSLSWRPGDFAVSHDVYLGENSDDVNAGTGGTFRGNQPIATFMAGFFGYPYPDGLVPGTTYYWRVDEVNSADPNSPWRGPVWSFTIPPQKAYNPNPPDGAKYVDAAVVLNWTAGLGARLHYVYFGDNFDTVNNATAGAPRGIATYTPTGPLAKGKTYYWRVDEFDSVVTHKGDVWSFTTLADIAITNPDLVGWWKFDEGYGKKAIDFSGHGNNGTLGGDPQWVEGVLDGALDLSSDYVTIDGVVNDITGTNITLSAWIKTTQGSEGNVFAANDSASAYALLFGIQGGNPYRWDGADEQYPPAVNDGQWHMLTYVRNGSTGYIYVDGVQRAAYSSSFTWTSPVVTRWSIGQEWDSSPSDFYNGLVDDVRIYNKALTADEVKQLTRGDLLRAWSPSPNNRSTVDVERARQPLTWSPGDKASQHDVYFGLDKDAVSNAGATDTTGIYRGRQSARSYSPSEALAWGTGPYYWRIDEVNTDGTVTPGSIWSFSVANYLVVDDIESYNDLAETDPASNRIYKKWIDGYGTTTNGAMVGNLDVPLTERANVHGGGQAMPLSYDNNRKFSEATLTLTAGRDWTREGVANLSLWFRGVATNAAEKMYVALNGTAVVYNNDTSLTQKTGWTEWVIPLQQFAGLGVNLSNVTSITIGFGTRGNTTVAGGTGQMYIDDIRLYRP